MTRFLPLLAAILLPICAFAADPAAKCLVLQQILHLENTTILNVTYIASPTNVTTPVSCQSTAPLTSAPLCHVQFVIATTSAVHAEAWLADTWFGRFMGTGNGGLGGCIDYTALDYGTSLHFATFGTDNGHDGASGLPFLNHPEVINDFAFRAVHVEAVIGKGPPGHASRPEIPRGLRRHLSWGAGDGFQPFARLVRAFKPLRATNASASAVNTSQKFIPPSLWSLVSAEILRQCDALDGVVDGIITEPDICDFCPELLACVGNKITNCLTRIQIQASRNICSPIFGAQGQLIYPRYSPCAEADPVSRLIIGASFFQFTAVWERARFTNFGLRDIALFDKINPEGIATFDGDLSLLPSKFRLQLCDMQATLQNLTETPSTSINLPNAQRSKFVLGNSIGCRLCFNGPLTLSCKWYAPSSFAIGLTYATGGLASIINSLRILELWGCATPGHIFPSTTRNPAQEGFLEVISMDEFLVPSESLTLAV
ncbi:tannase and feruloyl esterase [Mycena latifolia]|nr:tannase and feruloyl esterase [Mycena latifolia]